MALIEIRNLSYTYPTGKIALKQINLKIEKGEKIGIAGQNGAGKSTFLFCLAGLLDYEGEILIDGMEAKKNLKKLREKIGFLFEDPDSQLFCLNVFEELSFGPLQLGYKNEEVKEMVEKTLKKIGIEDFKEREPQHLSIGEKKKVALGTALVLNPDILILDDPTSYLDPATRREYMELIFSLKDKTQIISSHDLDFLEKCTEKLIILNNGKITEEGSTKEIIKNKEILFKNRLL